MNVRPEPAGGSLLWFPFFLIFSTIRGHTNSRLKTDRNIMWGWNESKLTTGNIDSVLIVSPPENDSVYLSRKVGLTPY